MTQIQPNLFSFATQIGGEGLISILLCCIFTLSLPGIFVFIKLRKINYFPQIFIIENFKNIGKLKKWYNK